MKGRVLLCLGVVVGLAQLQNPVVVTKDDLARQTERICALVGKARRNLPSMDLVVFPEYALHGLSMDTNPDIMCTLDGPEVAAFKKACVDNKIWGCFSIMELNPGRMPFNSGIIIDDTGELRGVLRYRPRHRRLDCCCRCADLRIGPRQVDGSYRPTITGVSRDQPGQRAHPRVERLLHHRAFRRRRLCRPPLCRGRAAGPGRRAGRWLQRPAAARRRIVMASEAKQSIVKLGRELINLRRTTCQSPLCSDSDQIS